MLTLNINKLAGCLLSASKNKTCDTTKKIGGISGKLWLLNLEDANGVRLQYTEASDTISAITVQAGGSAAFYVDGEKYSHDWGYSLSKPAINKYFGQTLNIRTIIDNASDLSWLTEVMTATNLVAIVETNDQKFVLLGQYNGLTAADGEAFNSGQEAASDASTVVNLTGEETEAVYKYVDVGTGYADTLAYIVGLETPTA